MTYPSVIIFTVFLFPAIHYAGGLLTDCYDIYKNGRRDDGVYTVVSWQTHRQIKVYCDMFTDGGGWTVFQQRFNGSVDFFRNFSEYEHGFGNLSADFWLGLDYIQELASQGETKLYIELVDAGGTKAYEKIKSFYLSNGPDYTLHLGPTMEYLRISSSNRFGPYHNGSKFSTYDHDADSSSGNCAVKFHGAWWYNNCYTANLNGEYITPGREDDKAMLYVSFHPFSSLKSSRMMIRRGIYDSDMVQT